MRVARALLSAALAAASVKRFRIGRIPGTQVRMIGVGGLTLTYDSEKDVRIPFALYVDDAERTTRLLIEASGEHVSAALVDANCDEVAKFNLYWES